MYLRARFGCSQSELVYYSKICLHALLEKGPDL